MNQKITHKLKEIELQNNVEILFACESGSRAWGFPSPDSDYDIRFVYKRKKEWYLNLWEQKDTIQFLTSDDLDGSGWDLRKALKLLAKSNASFLGWIFSPMIYFANDEFHNQIQKLAKENFNPVAGFHHFHSMSLNFLDKTSQEQVNLKKLFYALRTTLSAKWILEKESIPPILFIDMLELVNSKEKELILELIKLKSYSNEASDISKNETLFSLIKNTITSNESLSKNILSKKPNYGEFNRLFLNWI